MKGTGTSVFDPVLTELIYRWFRPLEGSKVFDPFAGGSVRGIVASMLGLEYTGIDLRKEQIDANKSNAAEMKIGNMPKWITGDSLDQDKWVGDGTQDIVIACPPYYDLEQYSDDPADISNMSNDEFDAAYENIMAKAARKLKPNRFACVVLSDVRDKNGFYRDLSGLTKRAMAVGGAKLYNEIILADPLGSAAMRARRAMKSRKVTRVHQEVLVFFNGNQNEIESTFGIMKDIDESLEEYSRDDEQ